MNRVLMLGALAAATLIAQADKYMGPKPPKPDLPYLLHATTLLETDTGSAREEKTKDGLLYVLDGTAAKSRTPLAEPIFILSAKKLLPDKISCWKMTVKGGRRELSIPAKPKKDSPRPARILVTKLEGDLYKLELSENLENGEYVLSPDGSNEVFAFTVY
ncbi:MAG: hypothetical protein K2Q23_09125 [Bryobacteraceae bacterium]|nr:hypothetical protein [Bryobacteraceae bacterium]